jgi:predicted enzyme related to lactoylglutathione lyase
MTHLKIDYVEFASTELSRSKAFSGKAFGWTFQDYGPDYAAMTNAGLDGGLQSDPAEASAPPLVILKADDLEAAEKAVTAAGGVVTRAIFAFPGGRRFHFREPGGNELAVWSEKTP